MIRPIALVLILATTAGIAGTMPTAVGAAAGNEADDPGENVTLCHRTSSAAHPYETVTVSPNSLETHLSHGGDIIPAPAGGCPQRDETCRERGLPCESIPFVPAQVWTLGGVLAGLSLMAWRFRRRSVGAGDAHR